MDYIEALQDSLGIEANKELLPLQLTFCAWRMITLELYILDTKSIYYFKSVNNSIFIITNKQHVIIERMLAISNFSKTPCIYGLTMQALPLIRSGR